MAETKRRGRPKGSTNVKTNQWNKMSHYVTDRGIKRYMTILNGLEDSEFLDHFEKILNYFKPKMSNVNMEGSGQVTLNIVIPDKDTIDLIGKDDEE